MMRALEDDFKKVVGVRQVVHEDLCDAKASYKLLCISSVA